MVELSLSALYHYQFSSIFKSIHHISDCDKADETILGHCLKYFKTRERVRLQTDVTPLAKPHSPTLKERQFVKESNTVIKGNKPITIGYPLSCIHLSGEEKWSLPLSRQRVGLDHTESSFAVVQLRALVPKLEKALGCELIINTTDSGYTHAAYLSPLYGLEDLVCISRFRYGCKVFTCAPSVGQSTEGAKKRGATKIYDQCFYLRDQTKVVHGTAPKTQKPYTKEQATIYDLDWSEEQILKAVTKKGRPLLIRLRRWNDLKLRSKNGYCMKHKPFDLISCRVTDAKTGELVFQREMFFGVFGQRKSQVDLREAYEDYRHRYDIEPSFRFNKQQLFLDKYLCEDVRYLDNFLLINQLSNWLLYVASQEVGFVPRKWEQNKSKRPDASQRLPIAKTRRATETLFLTFDKKPFLPQPSKKGKGNIKKSRPHYPVVKKSRKKPLCK